MNLDHLICTHKSIFILNIVALIFILLSTTNNQAKACPSAGTYDLYASGKIIATINPFKKTKNFQITEKAAVVDSIQIKEIRTSNYQTICRLSKSNKCNDSFNYLERILYDQILLSIKYQSKLYKFRISNFDFTDDRPQPRTATNTHQTITNSCHSIKVNGSTTN